MGENNSDTISIINRSNTQVIGERANALPIKLTASFSWVQYVLVGFVLAIVAALYLIFTIQKQVISVEVSGRMPDLQVYEVK